LSTEFGCSNGSCISIKKRCNGVADCEDKLDERHCGMVIMDEDIYKKEYPPITKKTLHTDVKVEITMFSVDNFNEIEMTFTAKFSVHLHW
jgi:hypothetical protein